MEEPKGPKNKITRRNITNSMPVTINEVKADDEERISTGFSELDRVLGGGVVPGGLILVGGDPGIGNQHCFFRFVEICQLQERKYYIFLEKNL